jgi:lantibiotic modifying enzyme
VNAKIAARYRRDRPAITAALGFDPGAITGIDTGWGDPHRGGQTVARISTDSGHRLAFKPRAVEPERFWAAAVGAVEERLGFGLIAPRGLSRSRWGWVEWIESDRRPRDTPTDHRRLGAVLALLDLLDVRDAHPDNFVWTRGQPVLVDAETIAHPRLPGFETLPSIILTGVLPWPPGSRAPALLRGSVPSPALLSGYRAVHRLLRAAAKDWLRRGGVLGRFRGARVRVVLRPTRVYASALRRGTTALPPLQGVSAPAARRVAEAEHRALALGDVPLFEADVDGTGLRDERRVIVRNFFARSGWDALAARWKGLGPGDSRASVSLIRGSLRLDQAVRLG